MRRFEFAEGSSNKFWAVERDGSDLNIHWGRVGTNGQSQTKSFSDAAAATVALDKLVKEKTGKGYAEVAAPAGASIGKTAPKAAPSLAVAALAPVAAAPPAVGTASAAMAEATAPVAPVGAARAAIPEAKLLLAPVSVTSELPPWLANGEPFQVPTRFSGLALPSRRFPQTIPPAPPLARQIAQFRQSIIGVAAPDKGKTDAQLLPALEQAWHHIDKMSIPEAQEIRAVWLTLLLFSPSYARLRPDLLYPLVDVLVERDGLLATLDTLLLAYAELQVETDWRTHNRQSVAFRSAIRGPLMMRYGSPLVDGEWAFRRQLAAAPAELYQQCVARMRALLPRLHPSRQIALALLLPDEPELSNTLALQLRGPNAPDHLPWLKLTATDPAAIKAAGWSKADGYPDIASDPVMLATILQERRLDALPVLLPIADREMTGYALSAFGVPEAIDALARVASTSKGALARLASAVERWPVASIAALARLAAGASKEGGMVTATLLSLVKNHASSIPALRPWLGSAAEALIDRLLGQIEVPQELASIDELPPVLGRPPWLALKKKSAAGVLALEALALAPVEHWNSGEQESQQQLHGWWQNRIDQLRKSPLELVGELGFDARRLNRKDLFDAAAAAVKAEDAQALIAAWHARRDALKTARYNSSSLTPDYLLALPDEMAIEVWNALAGESDYESNPIRLVARFGLRVLPALVKVVRTSPAENLAHALHFGSVELAAQMARAFAKLKTQRAEARSWLLRFPEHAACALIAPALGKAGEARDCAGVALRLLAANGHAELLRAVAARYAQPAVSNALEAVLDEDPLDRFPSRRSALPGFWQAASWRRPLLAQGPGAGKALPDSALDAIGTMLTFPVGEGLYPGIEQVKDACTRDSLGAFVWDGFLAWMYAGSPSKDGWALTALGYLGSDDTARKLTPYLRSWPGEAQHARAVTGLDVLANIGSDVALMLLNGIAQKLKFKGLQDKAREKINEIAEARGLTTEELEDRLAPDLGLDAAGSLMLDFGPRQFRVGFDEALKPYVRDSDGARLKDLPKPNKTDDAELANAAEERFKLLKKDARTIASQQVWRLEIAMCTRRRWTVDVFRTFLAEHPLLRHLVQRVVWAAYAVDAAAGKHGGALHSCFRVSEDGSWSSALDEPYDLPEGENVRIGIPHALELPAADAAAFGQLFADYELLQPFAQLGRDTHVLTASEAAQDKLERWKGVAVPTGRVLGLINKGWRRGEAQDGGGIWYYTKPLGADKAIELTFEPGIIVGMVDEYPEQKLLDVVVGKPSQWGEIQTNESFAQLDPISASELIRDMEALRS